MPSVCAMASDLARSPSARFMDWRQMEEVGSLFDQLLGFSASSANELTTGQVCSRAVVVYFVLILFVRIGKKRFLGQATHLMLSS